MNSTSLFPTVNEYLSQRWIYENRYLLSVQSIEHIYQWILKHEAMAACGLLSYKPINTTKNEIGQWLVENGDFECHHYDFDVPVGYDTPAKFFDDTEHWNVVLFSYNPYAVSAPHKLFSHGKTISRCYAEKDDKYDAPKAFLIENIELGWIGFQRIGDCVFVNCIQLRGAFKEILSLNDELSLYKFLLRNFVIMVPHELKRMIVVPGATIMSQFANATTLPYSEKVVGRSRFAKITQEQFSKQFPLAAEKQLFPAGNMWQFTK